MIVLPPPIGIPGIPFMGLAAEEPKPKRDVVPWMILAGAVYVLIVIFRKDSRATR